MVIHVTTYIDANVPDMVLHENTYWTYVMTYVS
ncbi:hypothetical protein F383_36060 [Gossypium arboreum]|uniref:Uncharacterized protein n=1 Tax=Gossypium arboreum TaxID=29729 RepID=A0A0B0N875_GOSAR|nr:hypothetical protein F383_36060 [Gossypium arboreum]